MNKCPFCKYDKFEIVQVALEFDCWVWKYHARCLFCGALGPTASDKTRAEKYWKDQYFFKRIREMKR